MNEELIKNELLQTRGKCIKIGTDGQFAVEITPELISDKHLFKFLSFTNDLNNGLSLIDYDEAIYECNVFCFEDYQDLTSTITMYKTIELFKVSDCVLDEYIEENAVAKATIFKEVEWCDNSKAQLIVLDLLDEQGDVINKELKLLVNFDHAKVDLLNWDVLGSFGENEEVVNGIYNYLSDACCEFEYKWQCDNNKEFNDTDSVFVVNPDWGSCLWASYYKSAEAIISTIQKMND
ncbi:hypothetical protein ACRZ5S_19825 [Vibrio scophthalmi]|uniref:hypothetical protein n=1 Tax=Vibrio scophthalmi TaxID=45658 RepID=UPI003EC116A6